ncbi:MAG: PKD domain-containing protein [Bacteroidales bacterium]|nr:PKD domain-containing protein [Bacteroidales bacterium]
MKLIKLLSAFLILTIVILTTCKKPEETPKPTACFDMSTTEAAVNEQIIFTNCSENAELYLWNFGDGISSPEKDPTHTYTEAGNYTISLLAKNGDNYDQATKSITIISISSLSTGSVSNITTTTVSITGNISDLAGNTITQHGHCWSTNQNPTTDLSTKTTLGARTTTGDFTSNLTNLSPSTTYYVRAYVTINTGTIYGNQVQFTSSQSAGLPTVTTTAIISITSNSAVSGGNVTSDGGATVTAKGVCWSTNSNPTVSDNLTNDGSGTGTFVSNITGLTANTTYYVRAYATNSTGTGYGSEVSFTTSSSGLADLVGTWYGIDVDDGTGYHDYPSQMVTAIIDEQLGIIGLGFGWMTDFWGEKIIDSVFVEIEVNWDNGTVTIPEQYYITTLYDSTEYPYNIYGSGTFDDSGTYPTMTIEYELNQEGFYCAGWCYNYGYLSTPLFVANLTLDPDGKWILSSNTQINFEKPVR